MRKCHVNKLNEDPLKDCNYCKSNSKKTWETKCQLMLICIICTTFLHILMYDHLSFVVNYFVIALHSVMCKNVCVAHTNVQVTEWLKILTYKLGFRIPFITHSWVMKISTKYVCNWRGILGFLVWIFVQKYAFWLLYKFFFSTI